MSWIIDNRDKFDIYIPSFKQEVELIFAISSLDFHSNKIVDSSKFDSTILLYKTLQSVYFQHKLHQKSFIVILKKEPVFSGFNKSFVSLPTQSEAIDYIYMEELERNL